MTNGQAKDKFKARINVARVAFEHQQSSIAFFNQVVLKAKLANLNLVILNKKGAY